MKQEHMMMAIYYASNLNISQIGVSCDNTMSLYNDIIIIMWNSLCNTCEF